MSKITAISINRYRADAKIQRSLGLKVGGTMTVFSVSDGLVTKEVETWGPTPGVRASVAKQAFIHGVFRTEDDNGVCSLGRVVKVSK